MAHEHEEPDQSGPDLIDVWPADSVYDFQLRPGEPSAVDAASPESVARARTFRDVLGRFASGITVVTALVDGAPIGLTCQSFSSVSLEPPLVVFIPARTSRAWPLIQRERRFCINLLAAGQAELSNRMAARSGDKFAGVDWRPSTVTGAPVLSGTLGHLDCEVYAVHEAGDHWLVVGRVLDLVAHDADEPLLFYRGRYHGLNG